MRFLQREANCELVSAIISPPLCGPSADIATVGTERGQTKINHPCLLNKACVLVALHTHDTTGISTLNGLFTSALTLGQQNGRFLYWCLAGGSSRPLSGGVWPHVAWQEVFQSFEKAADWLE